jgi:transposase-like protein
MGKIMSKIGSMKRPKCEQEARQYKIGKTKTGNQRYRCYFCGRNHTSEKKCYGYSAEVHQKVIRFYVNGMGHSCLMIDPHVGNGYYPLITTDLASGKFTLPT